MGTRLYPLLKEGVTLNKVIGVSDDEYVRWCELKAEYENCVIDIEEFFERVYSEGYEAVRYLNSFELFGWGKFDCLDCMRGEDGYVTNCGDLTDMGQVALLLDINGVSADLSLIRGVYWC